MDTNIKYQLLLVSIDLLKYFEQRDGSTFSIEDVLTLADKLRNFVL
jgi:hypothetical protein